MEISAHSNGKFYTSKELNFLGKFDRCATDIIDWSGEIATIHNISIKNGTSVEIIENLWDTADRSRVGINNRTVTDAKIRSSKEFSFENKECALNEKLNDRLSMCAKKLLKNKLYDINHCEIKPYKIIIYKEGDHFDWHIDSIHVDDMYATMSVQVNIANSDQFIGGDLILSNVDKPFVEIYESDCDQDTCSDKDSIDSEDEISESDWENYEPIDDGSESHITVKSPKNNELSVAVFYQDTPHKITKIKKGYRLSIVFDIIKIGINPIPKEFSLMNTMNKLKEKNIRRVGFICNHLYITQDEFVTPEILKGSDLLAYQLFKNNFQNVEIINIIRYDHVFYRSELESIFVELAPVSPWVETSEREKKRTDLIDRISSKPPRAISSFTICFDKHNRYRAIDNKFRLGDVMFFSSIGPLFLSHHGDEDLYLGNEGFSGEIYKNTAVIAELI